MAGMEIVTRAGQVLQAARDRAAKIATAESCTGGLIFASLTEIAGSSDVMDRGFITYSNAAKTDMLGIDPAMIDRHGAVSEEVAVAMAEGARVRSGATIAVAVTGIAGPGGSEHKPEGRVCFALACTQSPTLRETIDFGPIGRAQVRAATVLHALDLIERALCQN